MADEVVERVLDALTPRFDSQDKELSAIRKILDEDTATSREIADLGDKVAALQTDVTTVKSEVRQVSGQQRRLQSRLDRSEVPAE